MAESGKLAETFVLFHADPAGLKWSAPGSLRVLAIKGGQMSDTGLSLLDDSVRYVFLLEGDELVVHSPTIHHRNGLIDDGCEVMRVNRSDRRFPALFEKYRLQQSMLNAYVRDKLGWTVTLPDSED